MNQKLICPCCKKERNPANTPLLRLEKQSQGYFRENGSIEAAAKNYLQWACDFCLKNKLAIEAKPTLQNFCDHLPYFAYFDKTKRCEDCGNNFVFGAKEQQYWYETLKFWVQSTAIACTDCRKKRRQAVIVQKKLTEVLKAPTDLANLLKIAQLHQDLDNHEISLNFLRQAKNLARDLEQKLALENQIKGLEVEYAKK